MILIILVIVKRECELILTRYVIFLCANLKMTPFFLLNFI